MESFLWEKVLSFDECREVPSKSILRTVNKEH
jgi:hypothetical protein